MTYDVIIIGAGPSGMMAAITAGMRGRRVLLLEKNDVVGKKLAFTGGGRCNLTNSASVDEIINNIPGNGRFLYGALSRWNNKDICDFFEELGLKLKEEDHGRIFPAAEDALTVIAALEKRMAELGVAVACRTEVTKVLSRAGKIMGVRLRTGKVLCAEGIVIATGGKSYSSMGSTGGGYAFAKTLGHTITPLSPGEVPLLSGDSFTGKDQLQGLSLQDVSVSVLGTKGKRIVTHRGDILFTHFGLSGPAVLCASTFALKELEKRRRLSGESAVDADDSSVRQSIPNKKESDIRKIIPVIQIAIDILPDKKEDEIIREIQNYGQSGGEKSLKNGLRGFLPERLLLYFLRELDLDLERQLKTLTSGEAWSLATLCKNFAVDITGSLPLDKAFVTCGGVSLKEIDSKTMESKLVRGLYFCGEVLDLNGHTGGFNLTAAFVTGRIAGESILRV